MGQPTNSVVSTHHVHNARLAWPMFLSTDVSKKDDLFCATLSISHNHFYLKCQKKVTTPEFWDGISEIQYILLGQ